MSFRSYFSSITSIRNRFLLLVVPLLVVVNLIFTTANVWQTYRYLEKDLTERLGNIADINAEVLAKPLWNFDLEYVSLSLESLLLDTDVQGVEVLDEHGSTLLTSGCVNCTDERLAPPPLSRDIKFNSFRGVTRVGQLIIYPSSSRIDAGVRQEIIRTVIMFAIGLIVLLMLVNIGFKRTIGTPLARLSRAIRLADEQHIRIPVDWESKDELGQVVESYNHLLITLANQEEALTRASMMKSAFLANMSHEIRTPMNSILGMAEMLNESEPLSIEQREYVATLSHSGQALLETINDILDISKIESGQMDLETTPFMLRTVVEGACDLIAFKAHQKNLDLVLRVHPSLPETVQGDPVRLRQVLVNLLGNAVKFTQEGSITLLVDPGQKEAVHFTIQDTGIGIAPERQRSIFQVFSQADSSTTRQYGGTGLGLAISKRLVRLMKGDISVVSEPGNGATFTFSVQLPAAQDQPAAPEIPQLAGLPVLLISPSPIRRLYLGEQLAGWGAEVRMAHDRSEALREAVAADTPFGLIILDALLPRETLEAILEDMVPPESSAGNAPQVVLLLGQDPASISMLNGLPVTAHLKKPVKKLELRQRLQELLSDEHASAVSPRPKQAEIAPLRMLLVEDSEANRDLVRLYLKDTDVALVEAKNGKHALDLVQNSDPFHVIFLDLQMPVMDGFEAARAIRSWLMDTDRPQVPLVALTADVLKETKEACLAMGFSSYLTKPIRKAELLETVASFSPQGLVKSDTEGSEGSDGTDCIFHVDAAFEELVPKLLKNAGEELAAMHRDLRGGGAMDTEALRSQAHTFRGTFASYGLAEIARRFEHMEKHLDQEDPLAVQSRLADLLEIIDRAEIRYDRLMTE